MNLGLPDGWTPWVIAGVSAMAVLGIGGGLTRIGPWYLGLRKPRFQPPGWAFGPAWTVIGIFTVWAAVVGFRAADPAMWPALISTFAINGLLNIAWTFLFFTRQRPDWALIEVAGLWASCLAITLVLAEVSPRAAWLSVPYVSWVSFAALLNYRIVRLNPGLGHA